MLDDLKHAWREAVENFWTELRAADEGLEGQLRGMQRQLAMARTEEGRLRTEAARTRGQRDGELREAEVCRRREAMARDIGDEETAGVAARYAQRHTERAAVLQRKLDALEAERSLLDRDIGEMESALAEFRRRNELTGGPGATLGGTPDVEDPAAARDFAHLRQQERERAAEERLEELKRRMR